ncbi:RNA polymerase factor sigma-54 [Methylophaga pinxianii]|uniref:RNA polymerase factor sigma-54 n=1 Tax=Methylophaga pinxianii TaxID=2881052 RepID=UPI001CF0FF68|nr:RNA polymerase factor sigma-54 [Methylophaga pinxianii]MCB2426266.1 RNA polymerase factor sigma-54 [Methylophaga pinxianii]UPH46302.1 RNA polymerase factor sigma-54 [Methylophaga pinxianii]
MKPSLQLRIGQSLSMTPQLQQAIRLLQLSSLELQTEIQEALETNPLLEVEEDYDYDEPGIARRDEDNGSREISELENTDIPEDLPVDSKWEDTYDNTQSLSSSGSASGDSDFERDNQDESSDSLQQHLLWQMRLTPFTETEQAIATTIIDSIEDDGYLKTTLEEIQQSLGEEFAEVELDEIETVLHRIHHFDPVGVGARTLRECLLIQLRLYESSVALKHIELLTELIDKHLDTLAKRDYAQIKRALKVSDDELTDLVRSIQLLNPRPGSSIQTDKTEYIVPDVYAIKVNGRWQLSLNPDNAPKLQIAEHYASLINRADSSEENTYLKNNLQEARWFLKSLQSRNETLLKVTQAIVERQRDFLDHGEEAMKPLVLADIAETVEMHESTISRVTTRKYLHTPRGIFELKFFFSSHVGTESGGECSATAIRAIIKKLVAAENPRKPLSDSKIADILGEQGINVARRTIAKYRETLAIAPSNERKRLV